MVTDIVDKFDRANDATGLGTNWDIELGNIQVLNEHAIQQAGAGFEVLSRALHNSALDIASQRVAGFVEIFGTTGSPFAEVFARFREQIPISPNSTDSGYAVRLERTATTTTLSIQKYDNGVATQLASIAVTLGSPADRVVPIQIAIQDLANGRVEITGFIEDLENPVLTFEDNQNPLWQQIGKIGFHAFEGTAQTSPQVLFHAFEAAVLDVDFSGGASDERITWNATKLVNHIRLNVDRNSALSELDFNDVLDFLNLSEMQFVGDVGPVEWLERIFSVVVPAGARFVRMPRQCSDQIIDIYDNSNNVMLGHRSRHDMNIRFRNREGSSGQPELWAKAGRAPGDRIQIELFPIPAGTIVLDVWARANPGRMAADDYPLVPQEFVDALIQATIVKSGAATGNEKLMRIASATYARWVGRARRKDRMSRDIQIIPARSLPRRIRHPVSRFSQRRFPFL